MFKKLDIFDFDGTLFRSPEDTPENRKIYESHTGIPWVIDKEMSKKLSQKHGRFIGMRRGWWGRRETLEPPLVPVPAPQSNFVPETCEALQKSRKNPEALTVVMTGRYKELRNQVLRICHEGSLFDIEAINSKEGTLHRLADAKVRCFFLGDDGPITPFSEEKPSQTFPWKCWIIRQFLTFEPNLETLEIWEDRDEHVEKFRNLDLPLTILVNHVK